MPDFFLLFVLIAIVLLILLLVIILLILLLIVVLLIHDDSSCLRNSANIVCACNVILFRTYPLGKTQRKQLPRRKLQRQYHRPCS